MNLIQQLEQEEIARLGKTLPEFAPGDTVVVPPKLNTGSILRDTVSTSSILSPLTGVATSIALLTLINP